MLRLRGPDITAETVFHSRDGDNAPETTGETGTWVNVEEHVRLGALLVSSAQPPHLQSFLDLTALANAAPARRGPVVYGSGT